MLDLLPMVILQYRKGGLNMDYQIFLKKLKNLRKMKGISMREMGEALGVTRGQICNLENGSSALKVEDYFKICDVLEISPCTLLSNSTQREADYVFGRLSLLAERDFRIVKDLIMLMELPQQDL